MKQIIGFANKFYTLWNYRSEIKYTTINGQHYPTGINHIYTYEKNVSFDLDKVKELYPNVGIDEELRGKVRSYERYERIELPANIFPYGKYYGKTVEAVFESDQQYCIWFGDSQYNSTSKYIKESSMYLDYVNAKEIAKQSLIASKGLKVGDTVEILCTSNGWNADENGCIVSALYNDIELRFLVKDYKQVSGMYPYIMPVMNGKAMKTKNKKFTVTIDAIDSTETYQRYGDDIVKQFVQIR
jgi:hypothetical protein